MSDYPEIAVRFARDTASHQMTVLHEDGLYRHLRFSSNSRGYGEYWFDLITTPGQLVFSGDGDSYVFRRTTDMFQFFRSGIYRDGSLHINPGYWSEKLISSRDAATSYSEKLFEAEVAETLTAVEDDYPGIAAAWSEHVASEFNTEYEEEALRALSEFRFGEAYLAKCSSCVWEFEADSYSVAAVKARGHRREAGDKHAAPVRDLTFTFSDMGEMRLQDFDWWFLWACQAIVWGIARYDKIQRYGLQALATPEPDGLRARVAELEAERHSTNEALDDAVQALRARETSPLTVYRASHDSIPMGLYTTAAEARKHCETEVQREHAETTEVSLWWREDEDTVDQPEDGEQELWETVRSKVVPGPGLTRSTGYVVTVLEVAAAYDAEADE